MTATAENLGSNKVRLDVHVPAEQLQESIDKVYRGSKGQFTIPGFRRGRAPRAVIESHYGPNVFFSKAFDDLFPSAYMEAVQETQVRPVGPPENVDIQEITNDGLRFSVEVYTLPEVKLGQHEGLKAVKRVYEVDDADVDARLERLRQENARWIDTEEPAKDGDQVVIDFVGNLNGEPLENGRVESQNVQLGSGVLIPGLEDGVVGMTPGEEREIDVIMPESPASGELSGKTVTFTANLIAIKRPELPELDDEFAEDVSEYDTLQELKDSLRAEMQKVADQRTRSDLEAELMQQVIAESEIEVPPVMITEEIDDEIAQSRQQLLRQGVSLEQYLASVGTDLPGYRQALRASTERAIKLRLAVEALVAEMDTTPKGEDLDAVIDDIAAQRGEAADEYRGSLSEQQRSAVAYREGVKRMMDRLIEMSEIETVTGNAQTDASDTDTINKNTNAPDTDPVNP